MMMLVMLLYDYDDVVDDIDEYYGADADDCFDYVDDDDCYYDDRYYYHQDD